MVQKDCERASERERERYTCSCDRSCIRIGRGRIKHKDLVSCGVNRRTITLYSSGSSLPSGLIGQGIVGSSLRSSDGEELEEVRFAPQMWSNDAPNVGFAAFDGDLIVVGLTVHGDGDLLANLLELESEFLANVSFVLTGTNGSYPSHEFGSGERFVNIDEGLMRAVKGRENGVDDVGAKLDQGRPEHLVVEYVSDGTLGEVLEQCNRVGKLLSRYTIQDGTFEKNQERILTITASNQWERSKDLDQVFEERVRVSKQEPNDGSRFRERDTILSKELAISREIVGTDTNLDRKLGGKVALENHLTTQRSDGMLDRRGGGFEFCSVTWMEGRDDDRDRDGGCGGGGGGDLPHGTETSVSEMLWPLII